MKKIPDMDAELALFEEELRKTDEQLVIQMETKLENQDEKNEKKVEEHKQEVGELGLFGEEEEDRQRNTFLEIAKRKKLFKKLMRPTEP